MNNLTAYKNITPEQMTILARAIVDQNETPDQASCLYCHQNTESYKKFSIFAIDTKIEPNLYQKFIWIGKIEFLSNDLGAVMTMIGKANNQFYRIDLVKNVSLIKTKTNNRIFTREISYCDHCGRKLS